MISVCYGKDLKHVGTRTYLDNKEYNSKLHPNNSSINN